MKNYNYNNIPDIAYIVIEALFIVVSLVLNSFGLKWLSIVLLFWILIGNSFRMLEKLSEDYEKQDIK